MTTIEGLQARLRKDGSLTLKIKVIPKSQRSEVIGILNDGSLKVKVAAIPEKGKANAELCSFLARLFKVPQRNVKVVTGESSPTKLVRLTA